MSAALAPGSTFGTYTIESSLGRGGMSVVYLAEDSRLGRLVAIKVLAAELAEDESFRTRFIRESQLAASLDHPNIVPVFEAGEVEGQLFIAMRYVQGTDLRTLLVQEGRLEPDRIESLIRPVAGALDAAHRRGLVHRDVKPANILIARDEGEEHPYLADFGLTKHTSSNSGLTKTGTFMGTVDYVAPEQLQAGDVDGRTDEYSLACVIYQCLTGVVPFDKETDVATLLAHLQEPVPRISALRPDVGSEVDDVIAQGMAKAREDRHPTCTAMMDAYVRAARLPSAHEAPAFDPALGVIPPQRSVGALPPAPEPLSPPTTTPPTRSATATSPSGGLGTRSDRWRRSKLAATVGVVVLGVVAIAAALVSGVTGGDGGSSSSSPGPDDSAESAESERVIFRDDFSDPSSGWDVFDDRRTHGLYRDGAYVLGVDGGFQVTGDFNTSTQELSTLGDVRAEAMGRLLSASGIYGLVCRAATPNTYYYFLVQGNGSYFIGKNDQDRARNLDTGFSPSVVTGEGPNRIAIECVDGPGGVTLRMFVNGIAVNTVVDTRDPIRAGATGFRAESKRQPMEVAFDDFLLTAPS